MIKKLMVLGVSGLVLASAPAIAGHHEGGEKYNKGEKIAKMFEEADTNADGSITKDEYMAHVQAKAAEKFAEKDTDGNGSISKEEAETYAKQKYSKMKDKRGAMKEKMMDEKVEVEVETETETVAE